MEVVNPFILKNKERMIVFLDQLSCVNDPNPPPGQPIEQISTYQHTSPDTGEFLRSLFKIQWFINSLNFVLGRELATLHHICVSYLPDLQNMSKANNSLKKLVTVTEMLSKHKLKYREMIS